MPPNGQIPAPRAIPALSALPRPLYARAESLSAGSWTPPHRHGWVQFSYAISGVLGIHTAQGSFFAPPQWGVWIPAGLEHRVTTSMRAQMRSLYVDALACPWAEARCRVLEVTPLARELIKAFCGLPAEYPEGESAEARLVSVLLDQLALLPEVQFSLPMPHHARLLVLCDSLMQRPDADVSLERWAAQLGMAGKTLTRLFQRETGLGFRAWRQRMRLLASLEALQEGAGVTQAALGCGYESTSAYIAAFKALFGQTPGELFHS